jgi:hypothetical protein
MNRLAEVEDRKRALVERSDAQRIQIAQTLYRWQARTSVARRTGRWLKNPFVLAGMGLLALKMPWRRTFRAGRWALKGWKILRLVQRLFI